MLSLTVLIVEAEKRHCNHDDETDEEKFKYLTDAVNNHKEVDHLYIKLLNVRTS